jgi:hypothetical protein
MTAEQIFKEIAALSPGERKRLIQRFRRSKSSEIPQDFLDALADFDAQRFVSMDIALNDTPPAV